MILSLIFFAVFSVSSYSQVNINNAIAAYNGGLQVLQAGDYSAAVDSFKLCISIAKELGEEGDDIRIQAENQLPIVNYEIGRKLVSEQNYDSAIVKLKETVDIAKAFGTDADVKRVTDALGQVYYIQGAVLYKQGKFNEALDMFNKSLEINPNNSKALYMTALSYKSLDDDANLIDAVKKASEAAKADNDNRLAESSLKLGRDYFLIKANKAKDEKKYDEAIKYLKTSIEFDSENSTTYFLLAQTYGAQKMWDEVISSGNKALEYEKDTPTDKAKIYYEMGNAYMEKGENDKACDAFKKASYGAYKESAEYQVQHVLKCE